MAIILNASKPQLERAEDDSKVGHVVEELRNSIEIQGDAAVRKLSKKFDN